MLRVLQEDYFFSPFCMAALAILFFSTWTLRKTLRNPNRNKKLPPSPSSMPIIGNLHQLGLLPHRSLQTLSKRHGRDLMLLHLGSVPLVVVSSTEAAREVMKTHDLSFSNRPKTIAFEKLLYGCRDVATAPYGEYWRQIKSVAVLHLLSNKQVRTFRQVREEETKLMVEKIRQSCNEVFSSTMPVNLSELFVGLTNDVICRVTVGKKYGDDERGEKAKKNFREINEIAGVFNIGDYIPMLSWWSRASGFEARIEKAAKEFDEFLEGVLEEHVENRVADDEDRVENFVEILLRIQRENLLGFSIDRTCIKALLMDMFAAGTDTTFTALESAMVELLQHPKEMKKLQNEIRTVVGNNDNVTEDDIKKMPYLKAVIKETLRLNPPAPLLLPRVSTQDVKIMGYDIVSGSQLYVNAWAIGRDPSTWDEPEEFRPERFLDSAIDYKGNDFGLIPFGAGRRGCPGIQFAIAVDEIALASVVHKFDWSLASELDLTEIAGVTVHKKFPLMALPKLASY